MKSHIFFSSISFFLLGVFFSFTAPQVFAQTPSVAQPSSGPFFPLVPCPTCTTQPYPTVFGGASPPAAGSVAPVVSSANPVPSGDPCQAVNASVADDNSRPRHHKHHGKISKSIEEILQLLLELINKLIEMLGGQPINLPENPGLPGVSGQPSVSGQPNVTAAFPNPCVSPQPGITNTPSTSITQMPSIPVPSVSAAPAASIVPSPATSPVLQ